ncbi:restriction endonuclease subunit S [Parageobacillus thermoglucosidasius]|uniref:restriction endonuclease subunit S n=1 Tax=Parageobacillus thermoglucosidasius TaxID=1426 RepID=UPI0027F7A3A2|nr:restriction endonuclease subunit S [Parageobacillus thermoglucosidasius]
MIEWKEFALEEVVEKFIDYRGKTPKKTASGVPLITAKIVKNGRINTPNEFIALEDYDRWMTRGIPQKGDVVMTTEAPLGEVAQLCFDGKVALAQRIITMRGKVNVLDNGFLKYMLQSPLMQHRIHSRSSGTTVIGIKSSELKKIPIPVPPIDIQKKIASILGSIDEKIELNLKMNETLEEMAMTLYKHWFVDFGPFQDGEFVESELGMIPEGWECIEIGEAVSVLGGGTPKTSVKEYWENGDINWFSPTDLTTQKSLFISKSSKKITKLGLEKSSAKLFPPYCVMMTSRATIGEISINREEACTNQGFITLIPNETFTMYQLYFWLKTNMDLILSIANGSTFKEVSKTNFKKLKILKPKNIEEFTQKCEKLFKLIESNLIEIEELTNIKDYLLPRLLSGEIDVSQAEKQVEEVL